MYALKAGDFLVAFARSAFQVRCAPRVQLRTRLRV